MQVVSVLKKQVISKLLLLWDDDRSYEQKDTLSLLHLNLLFPLQPGLRVHRFHLQKLHLVNIYDCYLISCAPPSFSVILLL